MDNFKTFGGTAKSLARNPLGIIALFIVLVYGCASLVTMFGENLTSSEIVPLIYFLIFFPVLVLASFMWLVCKHSNKLFAPCDFENEDNYVKMQMIAIGNLAAASVKELQDTENLDIKTIVDSVKIPYYEDRNNFNKLNNKILWVDDRPENNIYPRRALEAIGLEFYLALSTNEALAFVAKAKFAAIISDMGRKEGPQEGYVLLDALRKQGNMTPFFIYAGSNAPEHKKMAFERGAQGSTNRSQELFRLVTRAVITGA